jgi:DnaJ-class molecular chaperone
MSKNYYEELEIDENASENDIKKAFRRLSFMYHPDKNNDPNATAKFQKISEAYETLGDVSARKEYDAMRNNPFMKMMNGTKKSSKMNNPFENENNPIDELFSNIFGMPFGPNVRVFHAGNPFVQQHPFAQQPPFGEQSPFGFMQKPTPIIKHIVVPIDKILTETIMPIEIERWIIENENKVFESETIYVNIPKGADDGEIIILRDKGNIVNEQCKGDVKLFIKIENNTPFQRNGLNLIYEKNITLKEALCGFSFELKYITGKVYTINNHSGNIIHHGYTKVIPNMGFTRESHTGNLMIVFNIIFPEKLTSDTIEQLKNIEF